MNKEQSSGKWGMSYQNTLQQNMIYMLSYIMIINRLLICIPYSCSGETKSRKCKDKSGPGSEKGEKMIVMKCQRLRADKTYEEIEIEVPVDIFNKMVTHNNKSKDPPRDNNDLSMTRKLRNIFIR